jgi:hypothetical protein
MYSPSCPFLLPLLAHLHPSVPFHSDIPCTSILS